MTDQMSYQAPRRKIRCTFSEKGSRFIATLVPVNSEDAALAWIEKVRAEFADATHNVFAYRAGAGSQLIERASDDREPAGSAGPPMLQLLQGEEVSDVLVVATRYFGGTKLGIGGLTRAYRECARLCLSKAEMIIKEPATQMLLSFNYKDYGAVNRVLEQHRVTIKSSSHGEIVNILIRLPVRAKEAFNNDFNSATRGQGILCEKGMISD